MPTPKRRSGGEADGDFGSMGTSEREGSALGGRTAARVLRLGRAWRKLVMRGRRVRWSACASPQDVTSSALDAEGSICNKRSHLT